MALVNRLGSSITMEDDLGIVYHVDNAQQFWSELEDILSLPKDEPPTLYLLDSTLKRYLALCAGYHELYLQSPLQLEHACNLIIDSELFAFHSERMCEILVDQAKTNTDPHSQLIFYHVLLCHGRRRNDFFRSHKRWQPLLPLLMDHVLVEIDSDVEDTYFGNVGSSSSSGSDPVPIEAKLRSLGVRVLYEVCRVQKLSVQDLRIFDDAFIDYLFDLVDQTRHMQDETFNYSVIKLIVALNEQFMVASLSSEPSSPVHPNESKNRVLRVLMRRLGSSKTFGENIIFMLNRAQRTPEDMCMQLLVLKILYLLFTTQGTSEYFYTNDLCVLVDVFLRELVDLDEDSESLRHTYLRVLHPLLTKTQLRDIPYKRPQIVFALESLMSNSKIRDINPTTKRLVERCLSGEWCVQLRAKATTTATSPLSDHALDSPTRRGSASSEASAAQAQALPPAKQRTLKSSKSFEFLKGYAALPSRDNFRALVSSGTVGGAGGRRPSNASTSALSLTGVAEATAPAPPKRKGATAFSATLSTGHDTPRTSHNIHSTGRYAGSATDLALHRSQEHAPPPRAAAAASDSSVHNYSSSPLSPESGHQRRSAPPPPQPKRRKPPAIPVDKTNSGATFTSIKSSSTSPLGRTSKVVSS